ncbi:MAG TPA: GNAT family N-acetyltransferase [Fimbriimonas sp.]|nr:GNAT family N-acetyltransferase [Fimbriimonas sp.]
MITDFRNADFEALADLYNEFAPDRYAIDAPLLKTHTVDISVFDWGCSGIVQGDAFIAVKKSAASLYSGPSQDTAHITCLAFRDPRILVDMVRDVKSCLRDRGIATLQFGTDTSHFFPGCPVDFPALHDFLMIGGFSESGEAHDLERDLSDYECKVPIPKDDVFRPVEKKDMAALEAFFDREFPGRWKYDTFEQIRIENDPTVVFGLFRGGECEGFALTQREGGRHQIGGAVWRRDLGEKWGSLGPIGVSKRVRGQGSGNALLGKTLEYLHDLGVRRCIIDWTGLVGFYGGHGFEVTRTYRYSSLNLESEPL